MSIMLIVFQIMRCILAQLKSPCLNERIGRWVHLQAFWTTCNLPRTTQPALNFLPLLETFSIKTYHSMHLSFVEGDPQSIATTLHEQMTPGLMFNPKKMYTRETYPRPIRIDG